MARRRWKGLQVNPLCPEPASPGPWVDDRRCAVCGALYGDHRSGEGWSEAAQDIRNDARAEGDPGGGYRSRGPVLWRMRCYKLSSWYNQHAICGEGWTMWGVAPLDDLELEADRLPEVWELAGRYVVRGWWSEADTGDPALSAVVVHRRRAGLPPWVVVDQRQVWARWCGWGAARALRLVEEGSPTRGAFRVTVLEVQRCQE